MRKVLVADGAVSGRELLRTLLEHEGYEVFEAADSREAVEKALAMLPDLILVDVELPFNDGHHPAVREMRSDDRLKGRAIMAVTDGSRRIDRDALVQAGFSGYIAKPVVLRTLREQLSQLAFLRPE